MLNLLKGGTSDHPLANPARAAEILGALPADATAALAELAEHFESVRADSSMRPNQRVEATLLVDAAAQRHVRRSLRDYLQAQHETHHENRLWRSSDRFWRESVAAFDSIVKAADGRSLPPVLAIRALRAIGGHQRWSALRYRPLDESAWRLAGTIYASAERARTATQNVAAYPNNPTETTVEREFLRLLGVSIASPGSLSPGECEIMEYLVGNVARDIRISREQRGSTYSIDLARGEPPARRLARLEATESVRFLVTGAASESLESLHGSIVVEGRIPSSAQLPEHLDREAVTAVLEHVAEQFAATPPTRRQSRARLNESLEIGVGFDAALARVNGETPPAASDDLDFSAPPPNVQWHTRNVGLGGFEASADRVDWSRLPIRALVAARPDRATHWSIGIVRRLERAPDDAALVDVEVIARRPTVVSVAVRAADGTDQTRTRGFFWPPADAASEAGLVLSGAHTASHTLEIEHEGARYSLVVKRVIERGHDFEHLGCAIERRA